MPRTAFCAAVGAALALFMSHQQVFAAPIVSAAPDRGEVTIALPSGEHHTVAVPARFFSNPDHQPAAGDYFMVHDEFQTWCSKALFESALSPVVDAQPSPVTAKMRCHYIQAGDSHRTVHLHPVYDSDPNGPNASWSKATPSGQVSLTITNPGAYERFEEGKEYMVTFSPA
ncbi:hypothetical protein [Azospirillum sp.]|uniref:hypothetical protein n=1 Tax=Azospirillum sp. TaxID=34012 RepID=UPI003D766082